MKKKYRIIILCFMILLSACNNDKQNYLENVTTQKNNHYDFTDSSTNEQITSLETTFTDEFYNMHSDYAYVSGVDTTMEYRAKFDNGDGTYSYSNWTAFTGTALYFPIYDYEYTLQIRYQTSTNGNPSLNCEIPVLTRSAGPSSYVEYDSISEILAIYTSEKQIEVALGDGASYVAISPAYYLVDTFIDAIPEGGFNRIYIRYAATATEPASNTLVLTLYGRNPNTPDAVYYENGALYNLTSDMVFRFNGGAWYSTEYSAVNVTSFMSSTETTLLEIRYMPTDSASCSAIREITLPILE